MLSINTNLSSLIVQSNLKQSTSGLNRAIERMTTGFKINHAKDNAAGYSISTRMGSQLSSYDIALDNASMGLDLITTASEGINLIMSHLQRIRDLAEQGANGTYGKDSLSALQAEVDARISEINRVASNTEYNGIDLYGDFDSNIKGDFISDIDQLSEAEAIAQGYTIIKTADDLQAMENNLSGKYILMNDIDLSGYDWTPVGGQTFEEDAFTGEFNGNGYIIDNLTISDTDRLLAALFAQTDGAVIKNIGLEDIRVDQDSNSYNSYFAGLVAYADNSTISNVYVVTGDLIGDSGGGLVGGLVNDTKISDSYADVRVVSTGHGAGGLIGWLDYSASRNSLNNCYAAGSVYTTSNIDSFQGGGLVGYCNGELVITDCYSVSDSPNALLGDVNSKVLLKNTYWSIEKSSGAYGYTSSVPTGSPIGVTTAELEELIANGVLPKAAIGNNNVNLTFQVGINSDVGSQISIDTGLSLGSLSIDVSTSENARNALSQIDEYLKTLSDKQIDLGAVQNRLESVIDSIGINIDNLTKSQSTIRDADITEESASYIKMQILQQASATLLATANQTPAIALQLL